MGTPNENEYIVGMCEADGYYHLSNGLTIDGFKDSCSKRGKHRLNEIPYERGIWCWYVPIAMA